MKTKELKTYAEGLLNPQTSKVEDLTYSYLTQDKFWIAKAVKKGVTQNLFQEIKSNSPFTDTQWADFLNINIRTLQRYKASNSHIYNLSQSERIFELAEVVSLGRDVFDTFDNFQLWLNSPSVALGNEKPLNLLDSSYGKDLVLAELSRIEHGIFV